MACSLDKLLQIPTGELRSVEGTPFDLRKPANVGDAISKLGSCNLDGSLLFT
jgi:hypothetical protein